MGNKSSVDRRLSLDDYELPPLEQLKIIRNLGSGSFGTVDWVWYNNEHYALKTMKKARFFRSSDHASLAWNERNAMLAVQEGDNGYILPLECCFQCEENLYFLTPMYAGGDLLARLKLLHGSRDGVTSEEALFYLAESVVALEKLHKRGYCHRDIKPENIFIDGDGHLVLGDLGLALKLKDDDPLDKTHFWGMCGSYGYRSPECVRREWCGFHSDIYSLAMCFYFFAFGGVPWSETRRRLDKEHLTGKDSLFFPKSTVHSACFCELLTRMLEVDSETRITIPEIKQHDAFHKIDWKKYEARKAIPPWVPKELPSTKKLKKMIRRQEMRQEIKRKSNEFRTKEFEAALKDAKKLTASQQKRFHGFGALQQQFEQTTSSRSDTELLTPNITPNQTPNLTPNQTPNLTPNESPAITPNESPAITPNTSHEPAPSKMLHASQSAPGGNNTKHLKAPEMVPKLGVARSPMLPKRRLNVTALTSAVAALQA